MWWFAAIGFSQGAFALFTMYLPPLFPTLLRTTGAGFCYNIGRTVAAFGVVFFGLFSKVGDHRAALLYAGFLFLPAAAVSLFIAAAVVLEPTSSIAGVAGVTGPALQPHDLWSWFVDLWPGIVPTRHDRYPDAAAVAAWSAGLLVLCAAAYAMILRISTAQPRDEQPQS